MWHWSPETARLEVARDRVRLCGRVATSEFPLDTGLGESANLTAVKGALASCLGDRKPANLTLEVVVSDAYARFWIVTPPANATSRQDLRMSANWRFEELYSEVTSPWELQADWHASRPFMACALPRDLLGAIRAEASAARARVRSCAPRFISEWNASGHVVRSRNVWFGVLNDGVVTMALVQSRRVVQVRRVRQSGSSRSDLDAVAVTLRGLVLQSETSSPTQVVLRGDLPPHWQSGSVGGFQFEFGDQVSMSPRLDDTTASVGEGCSK